MKADPFQVGNVLKDQQRFIVPIYQRTYAWTRERQLEILFDSIEAKARDRLTAAGPAYPHYMGALLLSPRGRFAFGSIPVLDIVDGQQRLMTYQIFIAALRDTARSLPDVPLSDRLTPFLLNTDARLMKEPKLERFKLHVTKYDRSLFHDIIDLDRSALQKKHSAEFFKNGKIRDSAALPLRAWWYFRDEAESFVREGGDSERSDRLTALSAALLEDFRVIVITLDEEDDAQVIFETLNSGGEPLAAMDLVRNDVFHRAIRLEEDVDALMETRWGVFEDRFWKQEATQGRVKKPRIDFFLAHMLTAETGKEVLLTELYAHYKSFVRDRVFVSVDAELDALVAHAPTYRSLVTPIGSVGPLADLARQLAVFDVSTAYPLVFVIASRDADDDERTRLYRLVSSYVVRRALCGLTSKAFNTTFVRVAGHLRENGVSGGAFATVFADSPGDTVRFPTDDELRAAVRTREQYGVIPTPRLRYILGELEKASRDSYDEALGLREDLTIEHVLPNEWAEHWPLSGGIRAPHDRIVAADDPRHGPTTSRDRLKNSLGNLTLLTTSGNPRLGNQPFTAIDDTLGISKREALRTSLLKMNQEIAAQADWDEERIIARADILATRAIALWPAI